MSTFLRYSLTLDYKIEHTGSLNVPNAIHKNRIEDGRREETIIVPIQSDVIPALDKECLEYIKEQFEIPYKRNAANFERLTVPGSMVFNSTLEIVQWQDLNDNQQMKYLEGGYELYYQRAQEAVAKAISVFERKRQLDSGAPDPLLVSQTPAPDTAQKDAEQPPAVDAEQTAPPKPAQTPGASRQAASNRTKCGRPSQEEIDNICFAIIEMFLSYQNNKTLNNIKELDDAVEKINRRLSDKKCGIKIDVRRLDGDKIPGRLFRYLWRNTVGVFEWGYTQDKLERDKKMADEYINRYKRYKESLK